MELGEPSAEFNGSHIDTKVDRQSIMIHELELNWNNLMPDSTFTLINPMLYANAKVCLPSSIIHHLSTNVNPRFCKKIFHCNTHCGTGIDGDRRAAR